jgi:hypothetical protein
MSIIDCAYKGIGVRVLKCNFQGRNEESGGEESERWTPEPE